MQFELKMNNLLNNNSFLLNYLIYCSVKEKLYNRAFAHLKNKKNMKEIFLISSSRNQGGEFWAHCSNNIGIFLGEPKEGRNRILFLPYAEADGKYDYYTDLVSKIFKKIGYEVIGTHTFKYPSRDCFSKEIAETVCAVCVGGGNTWVLKNSIDYDMFLEISRRVNKGEWKYIGASAGTVMACPGMLTTNDMPPMLPKNSEGFGVVPFQINPHFVPGALVPGHHGEPREERIRQFLNFNPDSQVVGLPEGCWIEGKDEEYILRGTGKAVIFRNSGGNSVWLPGEPFDKDGML